MKIIDRIHSSCEDLRFEVLVRKSEPAARAA
jgi:hypothetical protein